MTLQMDVQTDGRMGVYNNIPTFSSKSTGTKKRFLCYNFERSFNGCLEKFWGFSIFENSIIIIDRYIINANTMVPKTLCTHLAPKVIKLFSCSTQVSMKFVLLINLNLLTTANSFLLNRAEHENFSANKYKNAFHIH